jgi:hypothetical protein
MKGTSRSDLRADPESDDEQIRVRLKGLELHLEEQKEAGLGDQGDVIDGG